MKQTSFQRGRSPVSYDCTYTKKLWVASKLWLLEVLVILIRDTYGSEGFIIAQIYIFALILLITIGLIIFSILYNDDM